MLEEARCESTPLLEKLKFLNIFSRNLDEFFMVRVATYKVMAAQGAKFSPSPEKMPIPEALTKIRQRVNELNALQKQIYQDLVLPSLEKEGISIRTYGNLSSKQRNYVENYFHSSVFSLLTPLAVDPSNPKPVLNSGSPTILVELDSPAAPSHSRAIALLELPSSVDRLIALPTEDSTQHDYILLDELIATHLDILFPGRGIDTYRFVSLKIPTTSSYNTRWTIFYNT